MTTTAAAPTTPITQPETTGIAPTETNTEQTIETPVEETLVEETTAEETTAEETTEETTEEEPKPKKSGFEKRVSKLNARIEAAELAAETWKREALKSQQRPQPQPVPQDKPVFANYANDFEKYTNDLTDWKINTRLAQQQAQSQQMTALDSYNKRAAEFMKSTPDFQQFMAETVDVPVAPEITQAILDSEIGPQVAYYLANNIEEVERLNALSPHRRLIEMGKIEDRVSQPQKPTVVKTVKPQPAPVKPVNGPAVVAEKSIYEMTPQELMAHRNKRDHMKR